MERATRQPAPQPLPGGGEGPRRRGRVLALAILAAVLLAGGWLRWRTSGPQTPSPPWGAIAPPVAPPAPAPPPVAEALRVVSVTGSVDHAAQGGAWHPLRPEDRLGAHEQLQTGPGSSTRLAAGGGGSLLVAERTRLQVGELTGERHVFTLDSGQISVDYPTEGDRRIRIEEAGGGAVAEARAGSFHVTATGLAFAVATQTGSVSLTSADRTVTVAAGEQALAAQGGPPSAPRPISVAVLLKVAEASRLAPAGRCVDTTGQVEPGALVTVDGERVAVDERGRFAIRAARAVGGGVEVRVLAPDGRIAIRRVPCRAEADAAIKDFRVRWKNAEP